MTLEELSRCALLWGFNPVFLVFAYREAYKLGGLEEFFQTLKKGRSRQLLALIDQIQPAHAEVGRALGELVRTHQFERLIPLIQGAVKEKTNG